MIEFREEKRLIWWMKMWLWAQLIVFILLYATLNGKITA